MFFVLMVLVVIGCALAIITMVGPKKEEGNWKQSHFAYQSATERAMLQLKDQIFTLELDVKKDIRMSVDVQKDIKEIRETRLPKIEKFLESISQNGKSGLLPDNSALTQKLDEALKRIIALESDNKKLTNQAAFLSTQLDELTEERDAQDRLVFQLRERETRIREQLKRVEADCQDFKIALDQATKAKLEMKDKLFKLKVISGDNERELEQIRSKNKELMDHLSYERNL
jgi:chromosome segregation ATPase